ncbi:MAG: dethiobiotin synthase [Gammaproteobacteria bacterium]
MSQHYFVTGTDTDSGKTYISQGLLKYFNQKGYKTAGIKPIASGGSMVDGKFVNDDALLLKENSSVSMPYEQVNPIIFEEPISPNIPAKETLTVDSIITSLQPSLSLPADVFILEGVGGWHVPLNSQQTMEDLVKALKLPVILVVGMRLGCLNHSLLTFRAILNSGLTCVGWIANQIDPNMLAVPENIKTLEQHIAAPCLGVVGYQQKPEELLFLNADIA